MKQSNKKNQKVRKTRPFEGMMNQLKRETLVLVNMDKFEDFKKALNDADVDYDLGDFYGNGIFVVKK
jgi:hypothetical protein